MTERPDIVQQVVEVVGVMWSEIECKIEVLGGIVNGAVVRQKHVQKWLHSV